MSKLHIRGKYRFYLIPKNACTAILTAMYGLHDKTVEDVHVITQIPPPPTDNDDPDAIRFAVVRNPWDRFVSAWKNKVLHPHRPDVGLLRQTGVRRGMSLDAFAKAFLEHGHTWRDAHMTHQHQFLPADWSNLHLIPFEGLNSEWARLGMEAEFGTLARRNASINIERRLEFCSCRANIEEHYETDAAIWLKTLKEYNNA